MRVTIDGRDYVLKEDTFRLTIEHFEAADKWPDRCEAIKWAMEVQATVAEMKAWHRAIHGEDLAEPEPKKKVEPLPVPGKRRSLFS